MLLYMKVGSLLAYILGHVCKFLLIVGGTNFTEVIVFQKLVILVEIEKNGDIIVGGCCFR
jgi:hypothetical protein